MQIWSQKKLCGFERLGPDHSLRNFLCLLVLEQAEIGSLEFREKQ